MSSGHYMIGQRIGDYLIQDVLGEGGMGVVFKGVQERLAQIVAIKMLHPSLVQEERLKSRFVREAQALARLNHPNVVRLLNFLNADDNLFIVMEFMEGQGIDEILQSTGLIPEVKAAEIFVQVLAAMHYAHSLGIIHRDIKPSNLAVLDNGGVKVLDFGTAKIIGEQRLTQEGMTLGTLIYMSPEQICGRELDHRSDIYSLGVTLYEMVTAHVPHFCEDEMELIREIARGTPDPPTKYYPYLSKDLERIILKSIEKDPALRYQTADAFLKDINAFLAKQKGSGKAERRTPASGSRAIEDDVRSAAKELERRRAAGAARPAPGGLNTGLLIVAIGVLVVFAVLGIVMIAALEQAGLAAVSMAIGVIAALAIGVLAFRGGAGLGVGAAGGPPAQAIGEATIALDDEPRKSAPPPPPPPPPPPQPPPPDTPTERDLPPFPGQGAVPQGPMAYLYAVEGPDKGNSWPIPCGAVTIGRGAHNTIVLSDGGVSTSHAQIGYDGRQFLLTDLQSRNGCFVNNRRISVAPLNDRDVVHFGSSQFSFSLAVPQNA